MIAPDEPTFLIAVPHVNIMAARSTTAAAVGVVAVDDDLAATLEARIHEPHPISEGPVVATISRLVAPIVHTLECRIQALAEALARVQMLNLQLQERITHFERGQ